MQQGHLAATTPTFGRAAGRGHADGRHARRPDPPPSTDAAVDRLCRQLRDVCASAVDPLEIAAALEAEAGLTGAVLRARYGCADVFALADAMYARTARWPAEPPPQPDPWAADAPTHVGHAVLYGLPAASYAVAAPLLADAAALTAALVAMVLSWTLAQALAHLGYARLSRLDPAGAARLLRAGLAAGTAVLGGALAAVAAAVPVGPAVLAFAAAQGVYLLAATVLLVRRAERWVFAALLPGALGGAALLTGPPAVLAALDAARWLPLVASAALAAAAAVALTRPSSGGAPRTPTRPELVAALPAAAFGLAAAGLLAFPVAVNGFGAGSDVAGGIVTGAAVLTLPLSLSMGAAEWSLYRYRRDVAALLGCCRTPRGFRPGARRVLLAAVLRYLAVAAVLIAATVAALPVLDPAARPFLPGAVSTGTGAVLPLAYLALGGALFLALLLQAVGRGAGTGAACGAALGLEAVLALGPPALGLPAAQLVAGTVLLGGLALVATALLGRVGSHV